jgi:hypothetical protein
MAKCKESFRTFKKGEDYEVYQDRYHVYIVDNENNEVALTYDEATRYIEDVWGQ